jgi:hypothetical protein
MAKRFSDLISAFNDESMMKNFGDRKLFYVECRDIIEELLRYGFAADDIITMLENNDTSVVGSELIQFTLTSAREITPLKKVWNSFLDYRIFGILTVDFSLKAILVAATIVTMATQFRYFISWQFGK